MLVPDHNALSSMMSPHTEPVCQFRQTVCLCHHLGGAPRYVNCFDETAQFVTPAVAATESKGRYAKTGLLEERGALDLIRGEVQFLLSSQIVVLSTFSLSSYSEQGN